MFAQVIPLFEVIASKYCANESIVENLCECIKKTIVTLLEDILPCLDKVLIILHHIYSNECSIFVLKISRQIFTLFHKDEQVLPKLQEFYCSNVERTLQMFRKDFRESTYLAQVFYDESRAILKKCVKIFDNPKLPVLSMFDFATACLSLPEKFTIHHACTFLAEFITQARSHEVFNRIITERFETLLCQIFNVIAGVNCSSSYALEYVVDILVALNQKYSDSFNRALISFVNVDGFPTKHVTRADKDNFVKTLLMLRNNKRKIKDAVKEFHYRCLGVTTTK